MPKANRKPNGKSIDQRPISSKSRLHTAGGRVETAAGKATGSTKPHELTGTTLIVAADLGSFKAYRLDATVAQNTPRLESLQDFETVDAHTQNRNTLTIMEGQTARDRGKPGFLSSASDGEQHNMRLEKQRRLVKQLAQTLDELLLHDNVENCFLAVPSEIHHQFLKALSVRSRNKIKRILPLNLTKVNKADLLSRFLPAESRQRTAQPLVRTKRTARNQTTVGISEIATRRGSSRRQRKLIARPARQQSVEVPPPRRQRGEPAPVGGFERKKAAHWSAYRENLSNVKRKPEARRPPAGKKDLRRQVRTGRSA